MGMLFICDIKSDMSVVRVDWCFLIFLRERDCTKVAKNFCAVDTYILPILQFYLPYTLIK